MELTDIFSLLGGLALFLYGMQMMSNGLEAAAGNRMKKILEKLTSNRFFGCTGRRRDHSSDSVFISDDSHGRRICEFRHDDLAAGSLDHHGC